MPLAKTANPSADNMDTATTTPAPAPDPRTIKFGFRDYTYTAKKRTAVCNICSAKISDSSATTSNFIRHFKLHSEK